MICKSYESKKVKTSYNLEWRKYMLKVSTIREVGLKPVTSSNHYGCPYKKNWHTNHCSITFIIYYIYVVLLH